jgi:molybdopterin-guanine dinucleotide biosynthesis protein A
VLFLPNDMPFVPVDLLLRLKARFKSGVTALFVTAGRLAGFPFLLGQEVLPVIEQRISSKQFSLQGLANAVNARVLRVTGRDAQQLFNVNTPGDWTVARQRWRKLRPTNSS